MRELVFEASVRRRCAAPREMILAWERDPYCTASTNSRVRVKDFVTTPDGVGARWTATMTVGGLLKIRVHSMLMALDPVIVEARNTRVVGKSTTGVSLEAGEDGRHLVTFSHENVLSLPPLSYAYFALRRAATERKLSRVLGDYADTSVAAIEAHARAAATAPGQE